MENENKSKMLSGACTQLLQLSLSSMLLGCGAPRTTHCTISEVDSAHFRTVRFLWDRGEAWGIGGGYVRNIFCFCPCFVCAGPFFQFPLFLLLFFFVLSLFLFRFLELLSGSMPVSFIIISPPPPVTCISLIAGHCFFFLFFFFVSLLQDGRL